MSKDIIIERGGYIDETYCPGDYHFLWIDVTKETILGEVLDAQVSPIRNKVTSKMPSIRKRFNVELYKQIQKHKLKEKTMSTKKECEEEMKSLGKISKRSSDKLELLYTRIKRAIKCADKKCCKIRRGKVQFSDKIKYLSGKILILKLMKRRIILRGRPHRPRKKK